MARNVPARFKPVLLLFWSLVMMRRVLAESSSSYTTRPSFRRSFTTAFVASSSSSSTRQPCSTVASLLHQNRQQLQLQTACYSTRSATDNGSATSKSRAPFRMPKNSADDAKPVGKHNPQDKNAVLSGADLTWNPLGLYTELVTAVQDEMRLESPTPVQSLVIPELLKEPVTSLAFLAATGSGKTLAYALPVLQQVKQQETFENYEPRPKRPRALILAPTRELVVQITAVIKQLSHSIKLSSTAITGGEDYGKQRKALDRPVDIVVATPGRLIKHWKDQNVYLSSVQHVVCDEMDTMLEQGFAAQLREILYPCLYHKQPDQAVDPVADLVDTAPRIILTSATMTQSIQKMLEDADTTGVVSAKRHYRKQSDDDVSVDGKKIAMILPPMRVLKAAGLHKAVPRLKQVFVDVGGADKISLLVDIVAGSGGDGAALSAADQDSTALTMVFCNTAQSVRAVQYALAEARIESLSYHGELNSAARQDNLRAFRSAGRASSGSGSGIDPKQAARVLVCTDLAARGLDVPEVDHVVMFDFPLNALDYLHRSGRTARGMAGDRTGNGRVTALVMKRDKVLANAIETAVMAGKPLDGLSSRKTDYLPGGRLGGGSGSSSSSSSSGGKSRNGGSGGKSRPSSIGSSSSGGGRPKQKPRDTSSSKRNTSGRR